MNGVSPVGRATAVALVAAFGLATVLPLIEAVGRPLGGLHVPGSALVLQHLTLWLAFLGGLRAAREQQHLKLSTAELLGETSRRAARVAWSSVACAVCATLAYASARVVAADRVGGGVLPGGVPEWVSECVMPVAFGLMGLWYGARASDRWLGRAGPAAALAVALAMAFWPEPFRSGVLFWGATAAVLGTALVGLPVFAAMAGVGLLLFFREATPVSAVTAEIYRLVASPTLPAIPLLTGCGYILAESKASERLVRLFRAVFGWMPGGVAILVAAVCALFTTFTGGSGVTIIALGGLVYPILLSEGYPARFSLGLVTAAGSLGLLFPPSLPVILYSVVAGVPADELYLAGLGPGTLLVLLVAAAGLATGVKAGVRRQPFSWREAGAAAWEAKWELSVPALVVGLFASGLASMVEAAAAACAYAAVVECAVFRDLEPTTDLPRVLLKAATLVGAVLMLLASAMGLTSYLVDAEVPQRLLELARQAIHSKEVFLLALNGFLLVLGSVLEIYAAIVVLAPLVAPMAAAFGVDPVHLGIIFLANLELGFLMPPVGLNLFLSSSRFGKPLPEVARTVLPFLLVLGLGVLVITYWPGLSLGILEALGRRP